MTANVAASIRARPLNKRRSGGSEFELFLVRYACERFLKGMTLMSIQSCHPHSKARP